LLFIEIVFLLCQNLHKKWQFKLQSKYHLGIVLDKFKKFGKDR